MQETQPPRKKRYSISSILITAVAIAAIVVLAALFFYYSEKLSAMPEFDTKSNPAPVENPQIPIINPTAIIIFEVPDVLPELTKQGKCLGSSISEPFRGDAFRCQVLNQLYDPCFTTAQKGVVFCQMDPLVDDSFLINLTQALPKSSLPKETKPNWAWFVELEDGNFCSPYTGIRPVVDSQQAYYGCKSDVATELVVLMGDLEGGYVWTAAKAVLKKDGANWIIESSEEVEIKTVWQ